MIFQLDPKPNTYYVFNHIHLNISYHESKVDGGMGITNKGARIVAVKINLSSVKHQEHPNLSCNTDEPLILPNKLGPKDEFTMHYTYSVSYTVS